MSLHIRDYREADDLEGLLRLFYDSVREGTVADYDRAQREAWAPGLPDAEPWRARLRPLWTWVAEDAAGLSGFITLRADGHIDLFYVRPDQIGAGVGAALYARLERKARDEEIHRLFSEASEPARRFFARQGWTVVQTRSVLRHGVALVNHRMEKWLV